MTRSSAPDAGASLQEWLAWQEQLHPRSIELGLERVAKVAAALDLPARGILTLTVAGTNGKGSSATLAATIYREAGYRVGLYTSPHLLAYNERIDLHGTPAGDEEICAAFAEIERARGDTALTYFEFGTLAALYLFRQHQVQIQVLEVGLGGRLDAVNLVDADAALITSIGIDHVDWLGASRDSIGTEKAHIFRARRPAICAEPEPPATVEAHARNISAQFQQIGRDFSLRPTEKSWSWESAAKRYVELPEPCLGGAIQQRNAAGVIAAVQSLQSQCPVSEGAIRSALGKSTLRARYEHCGRLILDVAHNAQAAEALAARLYAEFGARRINLVLGMMSDKDVETFCRIIAPQIGQAWCVSLPGPRGLSAEVLCRRATDGGLTAQACGDMRSALAVALAQSQAHEFVLVSGSFLTVAAALSHG